MYVGKGKNGGLITKKALRVPSVEASNVINDPKCNKGPKCNNFWP